MKKRILTLLSLALGCTALIAQNREYLIKAAAVEKISRFIRWPEGQLKEGETVVIGIISENAAVYEAFVSYFEEQVIHDSEVVVLSGLAVDRLDSCDILYFADAGKGDLSCFEGMQNEAVLVISEEGVETGNREHIEFSVRNNRLKFELNSENLKKSGFYVWAQLFNYSDR